MPAKSRKTSQSVKKSAKKAVKKAQKRGAVKVKYVPVAADATIDNLNKIDHIVVLMMENRSFDHMLGYLKLVAGHADVDGLEIGMANKYKGKTYPAHHLNITVLNDQQDPCHGGKCVVDQLKDNNGGFVSNFAATSKDPYIGVVMGYYNQDDLPAYDHLAQEFMICDRWFSSVPGATFPNRLYALAGQADKSKDNKKIPIYDKPTFVRHLDKKKISWRWYVHDKLLTLRITTLRLIDGKYRFSDNYKKFNSDFFKDAAEGKLPAVSWIDPNFVDFGSADANDDHPPADIVAGQDLVLKTYHALINSPLWSKTLFIIVYDEHGGFFDHVAPGKAEDDDPNFRSYGLRVPAIIVSPWVGRGQVSHTLFDHTSIIKTILLRFCRNDVGSIPDMGARVRAADHLGGLLTEPAARPATSLSAYQHVIDKIANWHSENFRTHSLAIAEGKESPHEPTEFQKSLIAASKELMKMEVKAGRL